MDILFYCNDTEQSIDVGVRPMQIRPVDDYDVLSPLTVDEGRIAYTRPYVNDQRNGRIPVNVPDGLWETSRTWKLSGDFAAQFLMVDGSRVLVQQEDAWQLFEIDGTVLGSGVRDMGNIVLDINNERFYTNDYTGFIKGWDFRTGEHEFLFFPMFGSGYDRSVLWSDGHRVWLIGTELPVMSHRATRQPEFTVMEVHDLGQSLRTDEDGMLLTEHTEQTLITGPVPLLSAAVESGLVLAGPDNLIRVNHSLEVTAIHQGSFEPLALSLDEEGNAYLIVRENEEEKEGETALWLVTPDGDRTMRVPVPDVEGKIVAPPVIGFDRTVFVLLIDEVVSISPTEGLSWRQPMGGEIAGAVVGANHQLVVTAGSRVLSVDTAGTRRLLFDAENDVLRTPPALTSAMRLFVASNETLYYLRPLQ